MRKLPGRQRLVLPDKGLQTWVGWMTRTTAEVRDIMITNNIPEHRNVLRRGEECKMMDGQGEHCLGSHMAPDPG